MRKLLKITWVALLFLLVVFAVFADLPKGKALLGHLDLALYLKLVSLFGLCIALFVSMGYKHKVDISQKYQRAKQILDEAEQKAQHQKLAQSKLEEALKKRYAQKERSLTSQIRDSQAGYESRLKTLKQQNIELKEQLAKMMQAMKQERKTKI